MSKDFAGTLVLKNVNITWSRDFDHTTESNVPSLDLGVQPTRPMTLKFEGNNWLQSVNGDAAGIRRQNASENATLTIKGEQDAYLTVVAKASGAGIGGGNGGKGSHITIDNGNVTAVSNGNGAGIGGGHRGNASMIIINNGNITAIGKAGAGIGGGMSSTSRGIIINNGNITAISQSGAGIGGGTNAYGYNTIINGGTVTAKAGIISIGNGKANYDVNEIDTYLNGGSIQTGSVSNWPKAYVNKKEHKWEFMPPTLNDNGDFMTAPQSDGDIALMYVSKYVYKPSQDEITEISLRVSKNGSYYDIGPFKRQNRHDTVETSGGRYFEYSITKENDDKFNIWLPQIEEGSQIFLREGNSEYQQVTNDGSSLTSASFGDLTLVEPTSGPLLEGNPFKVKTAQLQGVVNDHLDNVILEYADSPTADTWTTLPETSAEIGEENLFVSGTAIAELNNKFIRVKYSQQSTDPNIPSTAIYSNSLKLQFADFKVTDNNSGETRYLSTDAMASYALISNDVTIQQLLHTPVTSPIKLDARDVSGNIKITLQDIHVDTHNVPNVAEAALSIVNTKEKAVTVTLGGESNQTNLHGKTFGLMWDIGEQETDKTGYLKLVTQGQNVQIQGEQSGIQIGNTNSTNAYNFLIDAGTLGNQNPMGSTVNISSLEAINKRQLH